VFLSRIKAKIVRSDLFHRDVHCDWSDQGSGRVM